VNPHRCIASREQIRGLLQHSIFIIALIQAIPCSAPYSVTTILDRLDNTAAQFHLSLARLLERSSKQSPSCPAVVRHAHAAHCNLADCTWARSWGTPAVKVVPTIAAATQRPNQASISLDPIVGAEADVLDVEGSQGFTSAARDIMSASYLRSQHTRRYSLNPSLRVNSNL
jgi:hypothetical protein